jgi:hypothetical protein
LQEGFKVIGLFMKIPFHAQIRSAESRLAAELAEAVEGAASAFAASRLPTEESFFLYFDDTTQPCRLRAAEAARYLSSKLSSLGPRLHGWALLLDAGGQAEEELATAKRIWYGIQGDGLYVSSRAKGLFSDYFLFGPALTEADPEGKAAVPILDAIYARPALPTSAIVDESPASSVDKLVDALGELGVGQDMDTALALLGPGGGPSLCLEAAFAKLYPETKGRFLRLRASAVECAPYGPIAGAFAALVVPKAGQAGHGALLSGAERGLLEELTPMLDFLLRSPYRRGCSPQIDIRLRLCTSAALRFYAREMRALGLPAFVVLEGVELFPDPSLSLVLSLFAENLAGEGIRILAVGSDLPKGWSGPSPRCLEIPGPNPSAIAEAALRAGESLCAPSIATSIALTASGDQLRLKLAIRLAAAGKGLSPSASTEELAVEALSTFPSEYAELLLALKLSEDVLTDECVDDFLSDSGYVAGVRSLVYETLAALGFVTRAGRPRIASGIAARRAGEALPDGGKAIRSAFVRRLLELRAKGKILPSAALYRQLRGEIAELGLDGEAGLSLVLDCIAADAVYGPSESRGAEAPRPGLETPLDAMVDFLDSYEASDRATCLASVSRLEEEVAALGSEGSLAAGTASLARAAFEYAEGRTQAAATLAKSALMRLHSISAPKAEAKAQRILGLCALAQEQAQEGADYLANAYEMAQALPEPLECILSSVGEAAADFAIGDLGKALSRAERAASWASTSFRSDWESVSAFIQGRVYLEIGRYGAAEECFGRVRAIARVYSQADAAHRAEIWTGRAAAFLGEGRRAREILSRFEDDAEALWFLAELEAIEGSPAEAVALIGQARALSAKAAFASADAFDWSSGFASLEGRAIGFLGERSYLSDQIEAFGEFASGLAAIKADGLEAAMPHAARLAALAREDRLAVLHPAAHLYLFYRYLILERATPSSMEGASTLSKAFKALQLRSMRLGEAALKDGFLEANRWNKALLEAARARKLL